MSHSNSRIRPALKPNPTTSPACLGTTRGSHGTIHPVCLNSHSWRGERSSPTHLNQTGDASKGVALPRDNQLHRRDCLRLGALGLSLPSLLRADVAVGAAPVARSCVL